MQITASIDRFEEDWAILMIDGSTKVELPRVLLPEGVKAGGWVTITIEENDVKQTKVKESIEELLKELKAGEHLK